MGPTRIADRFRVQRMLGRGGQSRVFVALDEANGNAPVVLKCMISRAETERGRQEELELFLQEGRILGAVTHPCLPRLVDSFSDERGHYVAEEYVGEVNLEAVLEDRGQLTLHEVAWLGHQMLDLLSFLHNSRPCVVLRDIKPSNITCAVDEDGLIRRDRPIWFIDLTIAVHYIPNRDDTVKMGSPGYAPPEQYRGRSQPRSDLYALAVTMFSALSGHDPVGTPFRMPALDTLRPDLPAAWSAFFHKGMALEPGARFQSAREMRTALRALMAEDQCTAALARPTRAARRGGRVLSAGQVVAVIVLASLVALGLIIFIGTHYGRHGVRSSRASTTAQGESLARGAGSAVGAGHDVAVAEAGPLEVEDGRARFPAASDGTGDGHRAGHPEKAGTYRTGASRSAADRGGASGRNLRLVAPALHRRAAELSRAGRAVHPDGHRCV